MNTTFISTAADRGRTTPGSGQCGRVVVQVGEAQCEVRARAVAAIADVLGFDDGIDGDACMLAGGGNDERVIVDLLESRMIMPPRPRRRGGRPVSSRAVFFGVGG
ncbi:MAG: hypothetical protein ACKOTB_01735 [Planctomycetia bacterium]